eukprot:10705781-Alexandrium_andersonii.AAC.1
MALAATGAADVRLPSGQGPRPGATSNLRQALRLRPPQARNQTCRTSPTTKANGPQDPQGAQQLGQQGTY